MTWQTGNPTRKIYCNRHSKFISLLVLAPQLRVICRGGYSASVNLLKILLEGSGGVRVKTHLYFSVVLWHTRQLRTEIPTLSKFIFVDSQKKRAETKKYFR